VTEILTHSEAETMAVAREMACGLTPGDVLLLTGPLGAGKTAFVRGLAEGLGCDPDEVSSPTFTLIQEYRGRVPLFHVDLYRLKPVEAADLGLDDLAEQGVVAIEWPDRWADAPSSAGRVEFEVVGETARRITRHAPATPGYSTR
jgi:tRNA threonylcarbamoyladenosine biosynthesis protein TsaE